MGLKPNPQGPILLQCSDTVWLGLLTRDNPSPMWPVSCLMGR